MIDQFASFKKALSFTEKLIKEAFPIKGKISVIEATNFRWQNVGLSTLLDVAEQKKAKLEDKSLTANLIADVTLTNTKTGKVEDTKLGYIVMQIPHITARGSYILQGTERQVINQLRWRPGIYADYTPDNNIKVVLNTSAAGTYRVLLDRESLTMTFRVGATTNFPICSVLKIFGMTDQEIEQLLTSKIYVVNAKKAKEGHDSAAMLKKLRPYAVVSPDKTENNKLIREFLESKPLDPAVNMVTVNEAISSININALKAAVKKAIDLANGRAEPDDVESLAFKSILSFEDFLAERLIKAIPDIKKRVASQADRKMKIIIAMPPSAFSDVSETFFAKSEFTRHADQNNPVDIAAVNSLVTTMGEGGIQSSHAITDEVRTIHPSHLGLLDPMHTPEGQKVGVTNHLSLGANRIGNFLAHQVYDAKTGKKELKTIQETVKSVIAFPDQYDNLGSGIPKPRSQEIKVRVGNAYKTVKPSEVEYIFHSPDAFFSTTTTAIPFLPNNHANRVLMGDKHIEQAVSLKEPDKPLVMHFVKTDPLSGKPRQGGYEELLGEEFNIKAPIDGKVTKITEEYITVKPTKGKSVDVAVHNYYPLNSATFLHDKVLVKVGDKVAQGQKLTESNFTKDSTLALGKNLRVAYTAYKGYNFEDGIVISEGAAKKLTSVHKNEYRVDIDKNTKVGADIFFAAFPQDLKYIRDRKIRYGPEGVIRKGQIVEPGDILIPAFQKIPLHAEFDYKRLGKKLGDRAIDVSQRWDGMGVGEVVDVVVNRSFIKVFVKSEEQMKVGDKMCFDEKHELLTTSGWKFVKDVTFDDSVATLNPVTHEIEYQKPTSCFTYLVENEPMYHLDTQLLDMCVTLNHKLYVNKRDRADYELIDAKNVLGTRVRFKRDGIWKGTKKEEICGYPALPFLRFVGFYIAEGNLEKPVRGNYRIILHQTKPQGRRFIEKALKEAGITYTACPTRFVIWNKALWLWLKQCGTYSWNKEIPAELLSLDPESLKALFDGIVAGDGHIAKNKQEVITTTSATLRDQLQEVALKCGWSANWSNNDDYYPIGHSRVWNGQTITKRRSCYYVRVIKAKNAPQINHGHVRQQNRQVEEVISYSGFIHCIEVPNHILYTRRGDKPHWSGNSVRHGGKGIVTLIIPDDEMYRDGHGNVIDVLFNPAGVPSRVNTGQLFEAAAGKLADKTGKTYYTQNFNSKEDSMLSKVQKDLKAAGIDDEETIVDPKTGHTIGKTLVGLTHFYKLKHQVDTKFKARASVDETYTLDEQPAKSDESSAQRIGILDTFSLLSGNAPHFLTDAFGLKSQKNDDYWVALQKGITPPPPKVPFITEKFVSMLLGAGINLRQSGSKFTAAPLIDKEIKAMSHGEITKPLALKSTNLMPEKDGLFDPVKTGGIGGSRFNHIELAEPIANPLMLDAISHVARLPKSATIDQIIGGKLAVTSNGKVTSVLSEGTTGGGGVVNLLKNIDVEKEITQTRAEISTSKADKLNSAYKRLRYLRALKELKLSPVEAYTNKLITVVPAKFRHIQPRTDGSLNVAPANFGYREIMLINNQLKDLKAAGVDSANLASLNKELFYAASGLAGVTSPLTRQGEVSGFIEKIKGKTSPKLGFFQSRVLSRAQDLSARSTVIPNPKLGLDEIGLPRDMAMIIYKPFVIRRLVSLGYPPLKARELVETNHDLALKVLELEAQERPAIMNRAPSLHKFNLQAFRPRLITGKAVEVNPLIVSGYNMDFDGDTAGIHIPVSEDAKREAFEKLLPSKNLLSTREESVIHAPTKETLYGVYLLTTPTPPIGEVPTFSSGKDALAAYTAKKIKVNAPIRLNGEIHCVGQILFDAVFPDQVKPGFVSVTSSKLNDILIKVAKTQKSEVASEIITKIKDLGNHYVTDIGFSVSLKDLEIDTVKRDKIMSDAKGMVSSKTKSFNDAATFATKAISDLVSATTNNRFVDAAVTSGALGKKGTLAQMIATPVAVEDHKGNTIPMFINNSYAEGHDLGSYIATTPGARKGLIDKGLSVGETGYFNKKVVNSAIEYRILEMDCKSNIGVDMQLTSPEVYDRFVAAGPLKNRLVTPELARQLLSKGKVHIIVRSPMTCQTVGGVCAKCFGLTENGQLPPIGLHIGALAGQTIGERATQLTLKAFHSGGAVGGPKLGFERITEIVEMPENVKNKAVLASVSGAISKIEVSPTGGWFVFVKDKKHFIPKELGINVKARQVVKAGDKLSLSGVIKPQELLEYTGSLNTVRNFLVEELSKNYSKEQGAYVKRKLIETVVRPLTDKALVRDSGDALSRFNVYPGDVLQVNAIKNFNKQLRAKKQKEIVFESMLVGIKQAPYHSDDFVGALTHERLKNTLMKAPALALSTDVDKGHPMAQLALKNLKDLTTIRGNK